MTAVQFVIKTAQQKLKNHYSANKTISFQPKPGQIVLHTFMQNAAKFKFNYLSNLIGSGYGNNRCVSSFFKVWTRRSTVMPVTIIRPRVMDITVVSVLLRN